MKYFFLLIISAFLCVNANAGGDDSKEAKFITIGFLDKSSSSNSDKKGESVALKFIPPDEEGWSMERSPLSVTLKKNVGSSGGSKQIEAYLIKLDVPISPISGYIETIKRNTVEGYASSKAFKISALEVAEDLKDARCARVHLLLEGIQPDSVTQQRKWSEQYVLSCGLLKHKGLGFELRYYHRYLDSDKDIQFGDKAGKLLESVVIEDD